MSTGTSKFDDLAGRLSTIDRDDLAGHEGRIVGGQKEHGIGDIIGLAHSA
jgi:hypothetical protein